MSLPLAEPSEFLVVPFLTREDLDTYYRPISRDPPPVDIAIPFTDVYENLLDVFPLFSEVFPSSSKAERQAAVRSRHGIWRIEVVWQPQAPEDARQFRAVVHEGNCGAVIQRLKTDLMGEAKHVLVVYQFEPEKNHYYVGGAFIGRVTRAVLGPHDMSGTWSM